MLSHFPVSQHPYEQHRWVSRLSIWRAWLLFQKAYVQPVLATETHGGCPNHGGCRDHGRCAPLAPDPTFPWHSCDGGRPGLCPASHTGHILLSQSSFGWKIPLVLTLTSAPSSVQRAERRICSWLASSTHGENNFFSNN